MRNIRSYAITTLVLVVLSATLIFSLYRLGDGYRSVESGLRTGSWMASQAEFEHLRLLRAIDLFYAADIDQAELLLRRDLFWSRVPLLTNGAEAEHLRKIKDVYELAADLERALEKSIPLFQGFSPGDEVTYREARELFEPLAPRLHELHLETSGRGFSQAIVDRVLDLYRWLLIGLICATAATVVVVAIVVSQLRRARAAKDQIQATTQELTETSSRLDDLVTNLPAAVVLADAAGVYRHANPVYCQWAGLTLNEVVGKTAGDIFPAEVASRLEDLNRKVIEERQAIQEEVEIPIKGEPKIRSLLKFPIFDADRNIVGVGSVSTDLTAQREAERRLERAHRMETVGQLSGGMAHDFNNLLMVIRGNLDLLREELGANPTAATKIDRALRGVDRGTQIIQRLLAFARQQYLSPIPVRIDTLFEQTKALLERTLRENIQLEIDIAPKLPSVLVDPVQFESALINLALNAQDAMEDGGLLRFTARKSDTTGDKTPAQISVSVSDSGTGIRPELLDRVIEPFYTTKLVGKGSGLGLSMVYGFAKQTGGEMKIDSALGEGTTVTISLPATLQTSVTDADDGDVIQGSATILVVEDEPDVRSVAEGLLGELGYNVICAEHGSDALKVLESSVRLDLLFTDMVLPGNVSGRTLVEITRVLRPETKVLATSGYAQEMIEREGALPIGVTLLAKPYSLKALSIAIEQTLSSQTPHLPGIPVPRVGEERCMAAQS